MGARSRWPGKLSSPVVVFILLVSAGLVPPGLLAQDKENKAGKKTGIRLQARKKAANPYQGEAADKEIAAAFAPIFHQALGDTPRFDYLTNFDFDGDWQGDNNWHNAANQKFPLKGFVYYAVSETPSHYFIHYAVFHPRDYKGGERKGALLSGVIREGVKLGGQYDPTGKSEEAVLAHENDMEGCLVVAQKDGKKLKNARLLFVETLAHNKFFKYVPEASSLEGFARISLENQSPRLFIEPKGHGIEAYTGKEKELLEGGKSLLYVYKGEAENPDERRDGRLGYELLPLYTSLWSQAQSGANKTYGEAHEYNGWQFSKAVMESPAAGQTAKPGKIGSAFLGKVGAPNMARPPWGWFDNSERDRPLGEWFFSPAETIKRHFQAGDDFPVNYLHQPFLGLFRP
jgi:hypothetical protein